MPRRTRSDQPALRRQRSNVAPICVRTSAMTAVRYQIIVVFMLAGAVAMTSVVVALWYRRTFFTMAEQLIPRVSV